MADLGALAKFVITRLCGHFWRRRLHRNVVKGLHLMARLIRRSCDLRRFFVFSPEVCPLFGRLSLGPPFAKSQKMADLGALAKFVITRLCGHFWRRRLRRNFVQGLHLMARLIRRSCNLRRFFFSAPKFAHFLAEFPLVRLCKISENGRFGCPCQICHNSTLRALLEAPTAPKCCQRFAFDG